MQLRLVATADERLVGSEVLQALHKGVAEKGAAVLLVPSFAQVTQAQRLLAAQDGLSMAVEVSTPTAWMQSQWDLWGDGRAVADASVLCVVAYEVMRSATDEQRGTLALLPGTVEVIARLTARSLPWLMPTGISVEQACRDAGLTQAETHLVELAQRCGQLLSTYGFVSQAEAAAALPDCMARAGANVPSIVVSGFSWLECAERELLVGLSRLWTVTLVAHVPKGPASDETHRLLSILEQCDGSAGICEQADAPSDQAFRTPKLQALLNELFGNKALDLSNRVPVELLLPAGPLAEAELVAERVAQLANKDVSACIPVVVAVPDVERAWRELVPKLERRGLSVRTQWSQPLTSNQSARSFIAYAAKVAELSELASIWPDAVLGLEGPIPQLGNMDWWPPRELTDFLFEDFAHMEPARVWQLDAKWRGNRLLTPQRVLEMLQSERHVSAPVARATTEILRGRIGSAAAKLLAPYGMPDAARNESVADEERAVLQAVLQLAGTLHKLGVRFDVDHPTERPLSEVVELMSWAAGGSRLVSRPGVGGNRVHPQVFVLSYADAVGMGPGSAHALVMCGQTSAEQPVEGKQDVLQAILEQLGVEPPANPLAKARSEFRQLLGVARDRLIVERALADDEGQATYPSVMLSELLGVYGISASAKPGSMSLDHALRSERLLSQNLRSDGATSKPVAVSQPGATGKLSASAHDLVFVPQSGKEALPDGLPVLSASQIETYLECPYKWFSLRRLRLGSVDAGYGGLEMGSFAHRVLELTHQRLLLHALERNGMSSDDVDERLALLRSNPAVHIEGSRVNAATLDEAQTMMELEFELHREHMYLHRNPRPAAQLLVPHDTYERTQERGLHDDLMSTLSFETRILEGFEPRFFEWGFGKHELVPYAGAYLTGTVDRIDVSPHGTAVILDYKHKRPEGFAAEYDALQDGVLEGTRLPSRVQSLIYAQVVRRAFKGDLRLVGSVYLATKAPHALAGVADENVADLVFGNVSSRRMARLSVPAIEGGEPGMEGLLDQTEELIAEQIRQMLEGNVEARPRDAHACDFCPVMQCDRRVAR